MKSSIQIQKRYQTIVSTSSLPLSTFRIFSLYIYTQKTHYKSLTTPIFFPPLSLSTFFSLSRARVFELERELYTKQKWGSKFICSFMARGTVILAEYTKFTGKCLQKLPATNNKFTYKCDGHTFNYLIEGGFNKDIWINYLFTRIVKLLAVALYCKNTGLHLLLSSDHFKIRVPNSLLPFQSVFHNG